MIYQAAVLFIPMIIDAVLLAMIIRKLNKKSMAYSKILAKPKKKKFKFKMKWVKSPRKSFKKRRAKKTVKPSLSASSNTSSCISELPGFDKSKFIPSESASPIPIQRTFLSSDPNELRAALALCSADKKRCKTCKYVSIKQVNRRKSRRSNQIVQSNQFDGDLNKASFQINGYLVAS